MSQRRTCISCGKRKVVTKFYNNNTCSECLYICFRCKGSLNCDKICDCKPIAKVYQANRRDEFLSSLKLYEPKFVSFGGEIYDVFIRRGCSFYINDAILFQSECIQVMEWMETCNLPFENITLRTPIVDHNKSNYFDILNFFARQMRTLCEYSLSRFEGMTAPDCLKALLDVLILWHGKDTNMVLVRKKESCLSIFHFL